MESKADAERYHRYNEPDPEMDDGGYRTPHKPSYATMACWHSWMGLSQTDCFISVNSIRNCCAYDPVRAHKLQGSFPLFVRCNEQCSMQCHEQIRKYVCFRHFCSVYRVFQLNYVQSVCA